MRKRWVVMRCWAGPGSVMVPSPCDNLRFWTRRGAESAAARLTINTRIPGAWWEAARAGKE